MNRKIKITTHQLEEQIPILLENTTTRTITTIAETKAILLLDQTIISIKVAVAAAEDHQVVDHHQEEDHQVEEDHQAVEDNQSYF